jgi:type III pantothenate kinase
MLCIDVGNTRIKWCVWQGNQMQHKAVVEYESTQLIDLLEQSFSRLEPQDVVVSCVASLQVNEIIALWFSRAWQRQVYFVGSKKQQLGVINSYKNEQQMGVDRWVAMLAAFHRHQSAVFVIDCGTAITLDLVDDAGAHLGGLILPGLNMMRQSLYQGANGIQSQQGNEVLFASNTQDAVSGGCFHLLISGLKGLYQQYRKQIKGRMVCVITGGDGEKVAKHMECDCQFEADLILYGLRLIAELKE